ncbi:hypothetical protein [Kosakonia sp. MUSA4]|uniref:hypothetical protein n=1 Tax=Kosakonia sp. MUSA4 TaxID=2067958 RepID=UPI0008B2E702|nr:hypothetical protein [Kosakonia sp. MUSA4]QJT82637.1 hypothetical protein C0557_22440 [Kosakonia sp. MUSA4]SEK22072.1 hypothetical protein SAMN04487787_101111 [Kosakonia sacchari]
MSNTTNGVSSGNSDALRNQYQSEMDNVQSESMQDDVAKAERDRKNAFVSGYANSVTTMISSLAQNKIQF